jgi:hypothetical protein
MPYRLLFRLLFSFEISRKTLLHQVEILTPEEKVAWNNIIITEAALKEVKGRLDEWLGGNHHTLSMLQLRKSYMAADLRHRALPTANKDYLSAEKKKLEDEIARLHQCQLR